MPFIIARFVVPIVAFARVYLGTSFVFVIWFAIGPAANANIIMQTHPTDRQTRVNGVEDLC